jgi:hypothetical protein
LDSWLGHLVVTLEDPAEATGRTGTPPRPVQNALAQGGAHPPRSVDGLTVTFVPDEKPQRSAP